MELRTKLAITGIPIIGLAIGITSYVGRIDLNQIAPIIVSALVSGAIGLAVWGLKPKDTLSLEDVAAAKKAELQAQQEFERQEKLRHERISNGLPDEDK